MHKLMHKLMHEFAQCIERCQAPFYALGTFPCTSVSCLQRVLLGSRVFADADEAGCFQRVATVCIRVGNVCRDAEEEGAVEDHLGAVFRLHGSDKSQIGKG